MTPDQLSSKIRTIPDFPKKGIVFRDITTLLQDGEAFTAALEAMTAPIRGLKPDVIIGIEPITGANFYARQRLQTNIILRCVYCLVVVLF